MDMAQQSLGGSTALSAGLGIGGKMIAAPARLDGTDKPSRLNGPQRAAVIVQMIINSGGSIPLDAMSEATQVHLARVYAAMGPINKATVAHVLEEFSSHLDAHGLSFPVDTTAALDALEGNLSAKLLSRIRQIHSPTLPKNTWEKIADLPASDLAARITKESPRVGAIILSKLSPDTSSAVMELLEDETAKAVTFSFSETEGVQSGTIDIVAQTLLDSAEGGTTGGAFPTKPSARAAALLNAAGSAQRDTVLDALDSLDAVFAAEVRKAIFTFADILTRVEAVDIAKLTRAVSGDEMNAALKAGSAPHGDVVEFILANLSSRMAKQIREEMEEMPAITGKPAEAAMGMLTGAIRQLQDDGELTLIALDTGEGDDA